MRIIIAGGRHLYPTMSELEAVVPLEATEIVSGGCSGVDTCGEEYAALKGLGCLIMGADWKKHGRAAGPIRNAAMAEYGDILVLFWDGKSKGSANMKKCMEILEKPVIEVIK